MAYKKPEVRIDRGSPSRLMARAEGYVMVRHPHCIPYVMTLKNWNALPLVEEKK